jgi:hypothetical protein
MQIHGRAMREAKPAERRPMKGERRLDVDGELWSFKIGKGAAVIVAPNGEKNVVSLTTLTGRSPDIIERGQWKGTRDGMVVPDHVRNYVRRHRAKLFDLAKRTR